MAAAVLVAPALLFALAGLLALVESPSLLRGRTFAAGPAANGPQRGGCLPARVGALSLVASPAGPALLGCVVAAGALWLAASRGKSDAPLYAWSPLGLYGVTLSLRLDLAALTVAALAPAASTLALLHRQVSAAARHAAGWRGLAPGLVAAGAAWLVGAAGDLVTLFGSFTAFALAVAAWVWLVDGSRLGTRALVAGNVTGLCVLLATLSLARFNGSVAYAQLSPATLEPVSLALLLAGALYALGALPSCRWLPWLLLPDGPHTAVVALAVAGSAGFGLALRAFSLAGGDLAPRLVPLLQVAGGALVLGGVLWAQVASASRVPAAALAAWLGQVLLVLWVDTPATVAAGVFHAAVQALGLAALLLVRSSGPTLAVLVILASVAAVPGTVGGVALARLSGAAAAASGWSSWWSVALLASQALLLIPLARFVRPALSGPPGENARRDWLHPRRRVVSHAIGAFLSLAFVGPALAPQPVLDWWWKAVVAGLEGRAPLAEPAYAGGLPAFWAVGATCVLLAALRPPALALWVSSADGRSRAGRRFWVGGRRRLRRLGAVASPRRALGHVAAQGTGLIQRVLSVTAPVEERYYVAAMLLLAMLLMYVVGR